MDGLYLYCVRETTEEPSAFRTGGIEGKKGVFTVVNGDMEAVVSRVSLAKFASAEIRKKALEDIDWLVEKAVIHEHVIEEAMRGIDGPAQVIPMRFGIIFHNKAGLKETLDRNRTKMSGLLHKIQGKQEWNVKIYLMDEERFEATVKETNEEIRSKEREIASMPEGMAYFMEEGLKATVRHEVHKELDAALEKLFGKLSEEVAESARTKVLGREMTGKAERMVLNAAFLVHADRLDTFKKIIDFTAGELHTKGLHLEYSGPWPPFNFTDSYEPLEKAC
jgi:hypothetical protein